MGLNAINPVGEYAESCLKLKHFGCPLGSFDKGLLSVVSLPCMRQTVYFLAWMSLQRQRCDSF